MLVFCIATHKDQVLKLQAEVDHYFQTTDRVESVGLSKLKYLDAFINEWQRLHPVVPSGVERMTPKKGVYVGETFIPGETFVRTPFHTIFRGILYRRFNCWGG